MSVSRFHFISGLPRSGSTLLAALLLQNPRFRAGMSSPIGVLFNNMLQQFSAGSEYGPVVEAPVRRRMLRGLFDSYYADQNADGAGATAADAADRVIFDTNRSWCARMPALLDLFPQAKVIACVRNVGWVMDSIERLYQGNPYENTRLFNDESERSTVASRVETLAQRNRLVGHAWSALKEAYYGANAGSLLVVEYELLVQSPKKVLRLIYEFIGEPWFEHDFENIHYDAPEFDAALGLSGLHRVRPRVAMEPRRTVLPPDLFKQYAELSFWRDPSASAASVIRVRQDDPSA